jgi:general stress protein YciG
MTDEKPKKRRGFAVMSPEKQKEIASKGGKSAHAKGTAHQFTSDEARLAGTKGGKAAAEKKKKQEGDE